MSDEFLYGILFSMHTRIDYLVNKYSFTELNESPRLRRQWQDVLEECRHTISDTTIRGCSGSSMTFFILLPEPENMC